MKVIATPIRAFDLQPGDLFSSYGQEYWDLFPNIQSIGERVYIRTTAPASDAPDPNLTVYRITIEK